MPNNTTGVILAGGQGTRLRPLTLITNKHLLAVFDKPMIYYPIETLKSMGCKHIIIISGGNHIGGFAELLKDGSALGIKITYRVQNAAGGIAEALSCAEGLVKGIFPVILGDNYFDTPMKPCMRPTLFVRHVADPSRFGVYDPESNIIVEKPDRFISDLAVTGLYVYDESVFDEIKKLSPSDRGELEVTDINNYYLQKGAMVETYIDYWSDMGTIVSLNHTANHIYQKKLAS